MRNRLCTCCVGAVLFAVLLPLPASSQSTLPNATSNSSSSVETANGPTQLFYSAINAALDFVTTLQNRVETDFVNPAKRADAKKTLNVAYDELGGIISQNNRLIDVIKQGDTAGTEQMAKTLRAFLESLRESLDKAALLVPDTDKKSATESINAIGSLVDQKTQLLGQLYGGSGGQTQARMVAAQHATILAYQLREAIAGLITTLDKEDAAKSN